jgi:hypothetical protein
LTLPPAGGRYRLACDLKVALTPQEAPAATLDIDKDFDPQHIVGLQQRADGKSQLRDAGGRFTTVEGAEAAIDKGHAIIRLHARPAPAEPSFTVQGIVVDEDGKPIAGARAMVCFASWVFYGMRQIVGITDSVGRYRISKVRLPPWLFDGNKPLIWLNIGKPGYRGAQTQRLLLQDLERAGVSDLGTATLTRPRPRGRPR